jgi:hypothetical protein
MLALRCGGKQTYAGGVLPSSLPLCASLSVPSVPSFPLCPSVRYAFPTALPGKLGAKRATPTVRDGDWSRLRPATIDVQAGSLSPEFPLCPLWFAFPTFA